MKRIMFVLLAAVLFVLVGASAAFADDVYISVSFTPEVTVHAADTIYAATGWAGGNRGGAVHWQKKADIDAVLGPVGGAPLFAVDEDDPPTFFTGPMPIDPDPDPYPFFNPRIRGTAWMNIWIWPVGSLPVGEYELVFSLDAGAMGTDLADYEPTDGKPDIYTAYQYSCTTLIHVVP